MKQSEQWTSKLGFILAAAGSAIGLGAIWKFPYVTGTSGGGAFFVLFLLFTVLVGLPLLLGEFVIGRSTQQEAITAYKTIAPGTGWHWIGRLGVVTCFILLSFYSVVGGWIVLYLFRSVTGQLIDVEGGYEKLFETVIADPVMTVGAQFVFMLFTIFVVARGVQDGIEKANKYMMPALFLLFLVLIIRSLTLDGAMKGITFFLRPDFSKLTSEAVLYALGQSFFSLSVGVSVMVTYSSYLAQNESLPRSESVDFPACRIGNFSGSVLVRCRADGRAWIALYGASVGIFENSARWLIFNHFPCTVFVCNTDICIFHAGNYRRFTGKRRYDKA